MHISSRAVAGLLGFASISSGLPTNNNTAAAPSAGVYLNASAVTNTNKTPAITTAISASAVPEIINATEKLNTTTVVPIATDGTESIFNSSIAPGNPLLTPGPVVVPADELEDINEHSSSLSREDDDDQSEDSDITIPPIPFWMPGPVIVTDEMWEDIHQNDSYLLQEEEDQAEEDYNINKRDGPGDPLPPRGRTLADHMENHGEDLPECYKKCMRSEDGKSNIHMGKDTLGKICGSKWIRFAWWSEHHIFWCVNGKGGCPNKESHREAYRWLKWTCGDKPN